MDSTPTVKLTSGPDGVILTLPLTLTLSLLDKTTQRRAEDIPHDLWYFPLLKTIRVSTVVSPSNHEVGLPPDVVLSLSKA